MKYLVMALVLVLALVVPAFAAWDQAAFDNLDTAYKAAVAAKGKAVTTETRTALHKATWDRKTFGWDAFLDCADKVAFDSVATAVQQSYSADEAKSIIIVGAYRKGRGYKLREDGALTTGGTKISVADLKASLEPIVGADVRSGKLPPYETTLARFCGISSAASIGVELQGKVWKAAYLKEKPGYNDGCLTDALLGGLETDAARIEGLRKCHASDTDLALALRALQPIWAGWYMVRDGTLIKSLPDHVLRRNKPNPYNDSYVAMVTRVSVDDKAAAQSALAPIRKALLVNLTSANVSAEDKVAAKTALQELYVYYDALGLER